MILVTGGNGFVGQAVCKVLASGGHEVLSISRRAYKSTEYHSAIVDVTDKAGLEELFRSYQFSVVVHLAAMLNSGSRRDPPGAVRINVMGSLNLLESCRDHEVPRFVFGSSYNALGGRPRDCGPADESEPALPQEFYGETKRFVEHLGRAMADLGMFEFVSVRMPIVVGPGDASETSAWRTEMFTLLDTGGEIDIDFRSDEVLPMAHVDDVAEGIAAVTLAKEIGHGIYHLPSESLQARDLGQMLEGMGTDIRVRYGKRRLIGIPPYVDSVRIREEFRLPDVSIRERLTTAGKALSGAG